MAKFTGLTGYYKQKLFVGDEVRVLATMLWSEMTGVIKESEGKFYFQSRSGIEYDLEVVAYRTCSSVTTPYGAIKEFIIMSGVGATISRTELLKYLISEGIPFSNNTVDSIRNYFTQAGYLSLAESNGKRKFGFFKVERLPDIDLTKSQLLKEAYSFESNL